MRLADFDFSLPPERVAQEPVARRDASRLMVLDRGAPGVAETRFDRLGDRLRPGDLLVLNDTRVLPARLIGTKPSGGRVELLLVAREDGDPGRGIWTCMVSTGRGMRPGTVLALGPGFEATILGEVPAGRMRVRLAARGGDVDAAIHRHGVMPLPPYIHRDIDDRRAPLDRERYQTVYAREEGAIAAPTAGLHFTEDLFRSLAGMGVGVARLTLHVGPGTFQPVRSERVEDHRLEPEFFRLPPETAAAVAACRKRGGRVVAVGTTVTRVLESRARAGGGVESGEGWCGLYIVPGHRFLAVDALLTNFHLPRSSLVILVAAFAGLERVRSAYAEAVARGFRFHSYGDAMLIL
jgi:S-adenosylmethionine:tRNA ribosyltransferase-isomerase